MLTASFSFRCISHRRKPHLQSHTRLFKTLTNARQEITKFDNIEAYVTKPADYPHAPSKLLLLLTGGTGIHSTNNQLQADKYASEGFLVVMPDQSVYSFLRSVAFLIQSL